MANVGTIAAAVLACSVLVMLAGPSEAAVPPVIIVPGLTSSNLFVRHVNFHSQYPFCKNNSGWSLLWPLEKWDFKSMETLLCWLESLETVYNPATNTFGSPPGLDVTTFDFGGPLGSSLAGIFKYFEQLGWKTGKTLFSAPFDWRVPSLGMGHFFDQLKALVEQTHKATGQRVVLLACSFGPQVTLSFLHRMTQAWKDEHIAWFIAESPVWSGAPMSTLSFVSGLPLAGNASGLYRQIALRMASIPWLFPRAGDNSSTTWTTDDVILRTPSRAYTAHDYGQLIEDLGLSFLLPGLTATWDEADLSKFDPPMVNTLVTYGYNLGTPGYFEYAHSFVANASVTPDGPVRVVNMTETGDTIVPLRSSLRSTVGWPSAMAAAGKTLMHRAYLNQTHAYCIVPMGGPCFMDVVNLLRNGTVPPLNPAPSPGHSVHSPLVDAIRGIFL